jgi:single-strand DNA-binding protein
MSVNKVILVGNVGKDPETRFFEGGTAVSNFPLATSETYKNRNGERVTNTEWHNIVVWRGLAEVADKFVKKGTQLYIDGKIRTRSYDDKEGNKRYITEVVADNLVLLGKKSDNPASNNNPASNDNVASNDSSVSTAHPGQESGAANSSNTDSHEAPGDLLEGGNDESDDLPF